MKTRQTTQQNQDQYGEFPRGINHLGITVPDIEAATLFFKQGLGALWCYDGLTSEDTPREGELLERQLGLPKGSKIIRQRMLRIGNGPGLELFEIQSETQRYPLKLSDYGINHLSLYCDDIEGALARLIAAGGKAYDKPHNNSRYEDSEGSLSIYVESPWGMLIELQSIPNGYYYDATSEATAWLPQKC